VLRDQHIIAGIGNAYSDEVLHAAKMSPFKLAASFTPEEVAVLHEAIVTTLTEAVKRSAGLAAADLKGEKKTGAAGARQDGPPCAVCGDTIREVSFRRFIAAVLPHLPDGRQAAGRSPAVPIAQVSCGAG